MRTPVCDTVRFGSKSTQVQEKNLERIYLKCKHTIGSTQLMHTQTNTAVPFVATAIFIHTLSGKIYRLYIVPIKE